MRQAILLNGRGDQPVDATAFRPDWSQLWTAKEAEAELEPFKFLGEGWYLNRSKRTGKIDSMLIVPTDFSRIQGEESPEQIFLFCIWNHDEAGHAFNWIVNAPVRVDER